MFGAIIGAVCAIASAAISAAKVLGTIGLAIQGLKIVVSALTAVCKELGLIKEETEPEELGDKAIQAEEEGIIPEKFDSYEEYVKAVEEFEVDPEKSKNISEEAKQLKAAELSSGLLIEKFPGIQINPVLSLIPQISPEKTAAVISLLKDGGIEKYNNVVGVITNKEKNSENIRDGISSLVSIEKTLDSSISDGEALKRAMGNVRG